MFIRMAYSLKTKTKDNKLDKAAPYLISAIAMEPLAEKLRSTSQIKGVAIKGEHHVITLFSDYIIITLTDSIKSLPIVHQILNAFNLVSGE